LTAHESKTSNPEMTITLTDRLTALSTEALAFVPPDKADATARQWLGGDPSAIQSPQWLIAKSLALELALIVPSVMGTTAFDRLARTMKGRTPEEIAAAALLRRSRVRLARLSRQRFEDLATGEILTLLPTPFSDPVGERGRLACSP
jgi:hypothetical protein